MPTTINSNNEDGDGTTLRLAVFDLDYTIWQPEMYQLSGIPKLTEVDSKQNKKLSATVLQEARTIREGYILTDRSHSPMRVFQGAAVALAEIETMKSMGYDIQAAVASKTDEPKWARFCMDHLVIDDQGTPLISCFENGKLVDIAYGNKKDHFKRLHKKTGIPFDCMAFFDNEYGNIKSVSSLGVKCYFTPDGMKRDDWDKAKKDFGIDFSSVCESSETE